MVNGSAVSRVVEVDHSRRTGAHSRLSALEHLGEQRLLVASFGSTVLDFNISVSSKACDVLALKVVAFEGLSLLYMFFELLVPLVHVFVEEGGGIRYSGAALLVFLFALLPLFAFELLRLRLHFAFCACPESVDKW